MLPLYGEGGCAKSAKNNLEKPEKNNTTSPTQLDEVERGLLPNTIPVTEEDSGLEMQVGSVGGAQEPGGEFTTTLEAMLRRVFDKEDSLAICPL